MVRRLRSFLLEIWVLVALVGLWWVLSANSTSIYWPALSDIVQSVRDNWLFSRVESDLLPTVVRILLGFGLAALLGIASGAVLGSVKVLRRAFEPLFDFLRSVPGVVMIPIGIVLLGIDTSQKVFVVVASTVWIVQLNTADAVRGIDRAFFDVARVYGFRRRDRVFRLMIPAALPQIFAGLRIALAHAILLVVVAELVSATNGLGFFIGEAQVTFQISAMWSGVIVIAVLAYTISTGFVLIERRALAWHRGWRASVLGDAPDTVQGRKQRRRRARSTSLGAVPTKVGA